MTASIYVSSTSSPFSSSAKTPVISVKAPRVPDPSSRDTTMISPATPEPSAVPSSPVAAGSQAANTPTAPKDNTNLLRLFNCIINYHPFSLVSWAHCLNSILFFKCKFTVWFNVKISPVLNLQRYSR